MPHYYIITPFHSSTIIEDILDRIKYLELNILLNIYIKKKDLFNSFHARITSEF